MKNNKMSTFIIVCGILVLVVFSFVIAINLLPNNVFSDSFYVKVEDDMSAKIESLDMNNNVLTITTSGDALKYCVKSTKSTPKDNSICWKDIKDNTAKISVYSNEKYYIWIQDKDKNISSPMSINTNKE